jgi:hypothetical protein
VFVGAMVGPMIAAADGAPQAAVPTCRTPDFADAGMPLSGPGPATR